MMERSNLAALAARAKKMAASAKTAAVVKALSKREFFRGTQPSLWNFFRHGVTNSFLDLFQTCREQTRLSYVEGWKGRDEPISTAFGTCVHWILEQAYIELPIFGNEYPSVEWVKKNVKDYEAKWLEETPGALSTQIEQQEMVYGLAESLLPAYFKRYDGDFTGKYTVPLTGPAPEKWESLEEEFAVPYVFPDGVSTVLRGKRDGVFLGKKGKRWVLDTKCLSIINDNDIFDSMPMNDQMMFYLWATWCGAMRKKYNDDLPRNWQHKDLIGLRSFAKECPHGVVMNVLRRPGQRQKKDESLPTFFARVAEECNDSDNWDMKSEKTVGYFRRYSMEISPDEVLQWKTDVLDPLMLEVRGWWEGTIPHYKTGKNLIGKYGRCAMFLPITRGDYSRCFKRTKPFPELDVAA